MRFINDGQGDVAQGTESLAVVFIENFNINHILLT